MKPLLANKLDLPSSKVIDWRLITGATLFGIGWGIGYTLKNNNDQR